MKILKGCVILHVSGEYGRVRHVDSSNGLTAWLMVRWANGSYSRLIPKIECKVVSKKMHTFLKLKYPLLFKEAQDDL